METGIQQKLEWTTASLSFVLPELILSAGVIILLIIGLITKNKKENSTTLLAFTLLAGVCIFSVNDFIQYRQPVNLFLGLIRLDSFSSGFKILIDVGALLTVILSLQNPSKRISEFYSLILGVVLGSHLLVMSMNLLMVFLSLETISICSYILTTFSFEKKSTEGGLKYFLFGSIASAVMVYGFSWLFGMTNTLNFTTQEFVDSLIQQPPAAIFVVGCLSLSGYLYKIAAAPMHPWAPDVYESAPTSMVALFSVVPKLAGFAALTKFFLALNLFGQTRVDWQQVMAMVALLTITVGNLAALWQSNVKRLMAYSSIAQSGFLLLGIVSFSMQGFHFMLFYAVAYLIANFLIFFLIQYFEKLGITHIEHYSGMGKTHTALLVFFLIGLISLTGLPPTAGFTSKLFIFSGLWEAYTAKEKSIFLWLFSFGLLNTVISLFYYLKIPYYAFLKAGNSTVKPSHLTWQNLFALLLVFGLLIFFFLPELLMGWINRINFVL
ncbi:MAG: NADH-quinone oxidoreductase subunit N [Flammeovirgaceae bacterium]|nr:NADH-quinone oxidoreductase subunit N [Flammeovirgaceae bacterium]